MTAGPDEQGSPLAALADLVAVMDRLRSPGGCPWDAQQTHESLLPYAVEEVFEVVEAVEDGDRAALREELGDLLLQVVFHARLAQEHPTDPFGIGDLHRRWDEAKRVEKARESALDGIPRGMPALTRAEKVLGRARRAGLPDRKSVV